MAVRIMISTPLRETDVLSIVPSIVGGTALQCICT
jgi:hypothetical protein